VREAVNGGAVNGGEQAMTTSSPLKKRLGWQGVQTRDPGPYIGTLDDRYRAWTSQVTGTWLNAAPPWWPVGELCCSRGER
jgi:hypothetical protein